MKTVQVNDLANLYEVKGKNANAKSLFEQAIKIMETSFGRESLLIVDFLINYANFLQKINRKREAATIMKSRVIPIQNKQKSNNDMNSRRKKGKNN